MKWEKWEKKDYTQHNLSSQGNCPRGVGIPLRTAPEAPKKKKTWVQKEGSTLDFFKAFSEHMLEAFIHKQLDKLTADIHHRTIRSIDQDNCRLLVHCDFSQDHSHAMADQSMCEFFDMVVSSLFIAIAHFYDPVTRKVECEGWIFVSDDNSHSNNCVNHYLQQIHEHYQAFYTMNDFERIYSMTVWADNCTEQFKSRFQIGWAALYVNKSALEVIHLYFFCPQHGKGPPDGLGGNVKTALKNEEKFRRHKAATIDVYLWLQENFTEIKSPDTGLFSIRKRIFRYVPTGHVPRHRCIDSSAFPGISETYAFAVTKGIPVGKVFHRFCSCHCESCMLGSFARCENEAFLGVWGVKYLEVVEAPEPPLKDVVETEIHQKLESYRPLDDLFPFYVMFVNRGCFSPSIAMLTKNKVFNNASIKVFILEHLKEIPEGQFNDTVVKVPNNECLCAKRRCNCTKQHLQTLSKKDILNILVEETQTKDGIVCKSVLSKLKQKTDLREKYTVWHVPEQHNKFITDFNERRIKIRGDLRVFF
jgi:hypothetical protein